MRGLCTTLNFFSIPCHRCSPYALICQLVNWWALGVYCNAKSLLQPHTSQQPVNQVTGWLTGSSVRWRLPSVCLYPPFGVCSTRSWLMQPLGSKHLPDCVIAKNRKAKLVGLKPPHSYLLYVHSDHMPWIGSHIICGLFEPGLLNKQHGYIST